MSDHLLLMAGNLEKHLGPLKGRCQVHRWYNEEERASILAEFGDQIRVIGTNGHIGCSSELMAQLPNLEMIGCFGVGYDAIDVDVAKQHRIAVTNTPDVLCDAVAELALGLMIALARRIPQSDRFVRAGEWLEGDYPLTVELSGKKAGIVGLGRIGKELARRLQAMKMQVSYHGRRAQPHEPYDYFSSLVEMAAKVDWLILCLPGGDDAHHIISARVLEALGSEAFLVNVARGMVVDEAALCRAITNGELGGAALDVFASEPTVPQELLDAENVVLSPHAASATGKTRHEMGELVIRNITAHLDNEPLLTRVI